MTILDDGLETSHPDIAPNYACSIYFYPVFYFFFIYFFFFEFFCCCTSTEKRQGMKNIVELTKTFQNAYIATNVADKLMGTFSYLK